MELLDAYFPDWQEQAACRTYPQSWFFVDANPKEEKKLPGLEVCKGCEVKAECLRFALATRTNIGVFGGTTGNQRKRISNSSRVTWLR